MTQTLVPEHLNEVAETVRTQLRAHAEADWSRRAGTLEWDCRETLEHVVDALEFYCVQLARRLDYEGAAFRISREPDMPIKGVLRIMVSRAAVLAEVAKAAPEDARAFHNWGFADPSGFVAMGCDEMLIHADDIARGLGFEFRPPREVAAAALHRLFPWAPGDADPWCALKWANNRAALDEREPPGDEWVWWCRPLAEWDGQQKKRSDVSLRR